MGVDVPQMVADAEKAREGGPVLALSRTDASSVQALGDWVREMLAAHRAGSHTPVDPGPMAPHFHADEDDHDHSHGHGHGHGHSHDHAVAHTHD